MKESYSEVLARYAGPESYAGRGNIAGVATAGVIVGPAIELRNQISPSADPVWYGEGNIRRIARRVVEHGGVEDLAHAWKLQSREPGDPISSLRKKGGQRTEN